MRSSLLIPTQKTLELLVHQAQSRADHIIYSALTNGLRVNNGRAFHSVVSPFSTLAHRVIEKELTCVENTDIDIAVLTHVCTDWRRSPV